MNKFKNIVEALYFVHCTEIDSSNLDIRKLKFFAALKAEYDNNLLSLLVNESPVNVEKKYLNIRLTR
jgi:hypothetical protein